MVLSLLVSLLVGGVEVAPGAPCVDARAAERIASQVPAEVGVSLAQAKPGVLVVALTAAGRTSLRREVPASAAECEAVERVVLALVRSWLSTSLVSPRKRADAGVVNVVGSVSGSDVSVREPVGSGLDDVGARELIRSDAGTGSSSRGSTREPIGDAGTSSASRVGETGSGAREPLGSDAGLRSPSRSDLRASEPIGSSSSFDAGGSRAGVRDAGPDSFSRGSVSGSDAGLRAASPGSASGSDLSGREPNGSDAGSSVSSRGSVSGSSGRESLGFDAGSNASLRASVSGSDLGVGDAGDSSGASSRGAASDAGTDAGTLSSELRLGLSVLGGVSSGTTADVLPQGLLSFDLVWRWLGLAVDIGLSGGVKQAVAPGEVVASWQWLSLSGRAVWSPTERLLLDVQLGARAHRLVASATGFTMNEPAQSLFSVGGVGSVGASVRLLGPFGVTVRATGVLKPPERFLITNVPQALDFGALEGAVHAGLFARW